MNTEKNNIRYSIKIGSLIGKYLTNRDSKSELNQIKDWVKEDNSNQKIFNSLKANQSLADKLEEFEGIDKSTSWNNYIERLRIKSLQKVLLRWQVAAVFFLIFASVGVMAYINQKWNVMPAEESYTMVTTKNGESSKIMLPDSTIVWINSGTILSYNTNFAANKRDIKLEGQAYFSVRKNTKLPLTVTCNSLQVTVLGTKFDVSAYANDPEIDVVLESGSIQLNHLTNKSFKQLIKPGEHATFNIRHQNLSIKEVDTHNYTSWKDGILIFNDTRMDEVIKKLERWYNIDIEVRDSGVEKLIFNAKIVNENMNDIFELMAFTCPINYKVISSDKPEVPVKVIISSK